MTKRSNGYKQIEILLLLLMLILVSLCFATVLVGIVYTYYQMLNRYRGEKLSRLQGSAKKQKLMKDVIISTVYDKPLEHSSTLLRSAPPTVLKHRSVAFKEGGVLLQEKNRSGVEETGTPQRHAGEPS